MTDQATHFAITRADLDHVDRLTALLDGYRQFYRQPSDPIEAYR